MALAGAALALAFPPHGLWPLALVGLVPLLWQCWRQPPARAARLGFVFALALGLAQLYWLLVAMVVYGQVAWPLAGFALLLLAAILALYLAAFAALVALLRRAGVSPLLGAPLAWVGLEWLRAVALTGFPWLPLGNALVPVLPLIQSAEIWGVHGLSFWLVLVNALLARALLGLAARRRLGGRELVALGAAGLILAGGGLWGQLRLEEVRAQARAAPRLMTTVIQANIPLPELWQRKLRQRNLERHLALTRRAAARVEQRPWLVVWPESAVPFYFMAEGRESFLVLRAARELRAYILTGTLGSRLKEGRPRPTNRSWLVGPDGRPAAWYDKVHLVPFGEYVPLEKVLFFVRALAITSDNFLPGKQGDTLEVAGVKVGPLICYESIFPELARAQALMGARLLVNQTNDAWYGRTGASAQHMSHLALRSVENRRACARAANTGISGFVLPDGDMVQTTGLFEEALASRDLPLMGGLTFYTRHGEILGPGALALVLAAAAWAWLRGRRRRPGCSPRQA